MPSLDYEFEKKTFIEFFDENRIALDGALGSFKTLLRSLLASRPEIAVSDIIGRVKDRDECLSKFSRKYRKALETSKTPYNIRDKMTDLIGLRIVCLYEDDVEQIKRLITAEFSVIDITDKIAKIEGTEDSFGYKGLHLDLSLNSARKIMAEYRLYAQHQFELQIRTVVQDSWSVIDHKIKYKKSIPNNLKRRINTLAALFELADREFRAIRDATRVELELAEQTYDEIEAESKAVDVGASDATQVEPRQYAALNAFNFSKIAHHFFPKFEFEPHKIDGFTQEITALKNDISRGKLNFYLREAISDVKLYQIEFEKSIDGESMNPYTIMRHCLYAGDREIFHSLLTDKARDRFQKWIDRNQN